MNVDGLRDAQNVVSECFLIKLKDRSPSSTADQLKRLIQKVNGRILLDVENGRAFIVLIAPTYKSLFESLPYVETVGGVVLKPRKIRRIRVQEPSQGKRKVTYVVRDNQIVKVE